MTADIRTVDFDRLSYPASALEFLEELGQATWIRQPGRDASRTRALVTLLHGNEPSGTYAVLQWLKSGETPATNVVFYLASVDTALTRPTFSHRMLPNEPDANRCFREPFAGRQGRRAAAVLKLLSDEHPEALVDLHNNTGHNPAYGVATRFSPPILRLTEMFAERLVYTDLRLGTLVEATESWFPSTTIECGRAGDPEADELAFEGLKRFLMAKDLRLDEPPERKLEILENPLRVSLHGGLKLGFGTKPDHSVDVTVNLQLERSNFRRLDAGATVGWAPVGSMPLKAVGAGGANVASELFYNSAGTIKTRASLVPVMMTVNPTIALSDCLFYAMQRKPD